MNSENISLMAGLIFSFIFAASNFPMLFKAYQTQDMDSYSWPNLLLANTGNLIYWAYIISLPVGPIWILHTFFTISSGLMLTMYLHFRSTNGANQKIRLKMEAQ